MLPESIRLQPAYRTAYNAIVQPNRVFTVSQYFLRYWLPLLKPSLAWLIIALQQRGYWNEQKSWCAVSQEKLAQDTGLSERTIRNLLKEPYLAWFMSPRRQYKYNAALGRTVRDKTMYAIYQDDPLTPAHQAGLAALLKQAGAANLSGALQDLAEMNGRALAERLEAAAAGPAPALLPEGSVTAVAEAALGLTLNAGQRALAEAVQHRLTQGQGLPLLGTHYFRLKWLPQLGPSLAWLVMVLRNSCYHNPATGEVRSECDWPKTALREALGGVSRRQINNLLQHPARPLFFEESDSAKNVYRFQVQMWQDQEPLTPDDEAALQAAGVDMSALLAPGDDLPDASANREKIAGSNVNFLPVESSDREISAAPTVNKLPVVTANREKTADSNVNFLPVEGDDREIFAGHIPPSPGKICRTHEHFLNTLTSDNQNQQHHANGDDAGGSNIASQLMQLDTLGIRPPTREQLAGLPHLTPDYLAGWVQWDTTHNRDNAGRRRYGPGWLVLQLRGNLPPPTEHDAPPTGDEAAASDAVASEVLRLYAEEIGRVTPLISRLILEAVVPTGENLRTLAHWETAFKSAVSANVRQWNYVMAVARREHEEEQRRLAQPTPVDIDPARLAAGDSPVAPAEGELARLWRIALDMLRTQMTLSTFDAWLRQTRLAARDGVRFTVVVQNSYAREWLQTRLHDVIGRAVGHALQGETGEAASRIELNFVTADEL